MTDSLLMIFVKNLIPGMVKTRLAKDIGIDAALDVYMELVEKHKDSPYTEKDVAAQDKMRREWLIDQLFSDPYSSKIVPFEAWSLANVPPIIKF